MNVIILISEELEGLQDIPKKIQKEQYERVHEIFDGM